MSKYKTSYGKLAVNRKNKYASDCGAGKEGSAGFQPGNTCAGGKGGSKDDPKKKPKKSDTGSGDVGAERIGNAFGGKVTDEVMGIAKDLNIDLDSDELTPKVIQAMYDGMQSKGASHDESMAQIDAILSRGIEDVADEDTTPFTEEQLDDYYASDELIGFSTVGKDTTGMFSDKQELKDYLNKNGIEPDETVLDSVFEAINAPSADAPATGSGEGGKPYGTDSEMRVWLGSEGAYAEGKLVGEWVNASDAPEALESLTKQWQEAGYGDEWAVMDSEGVPDSLHHDMEAIANYANTMESHDNPEALQAYIDTTGADMEDAVAQFEDAYAGEAGDMGRRGSYDLPMGFVYDLIEGTGGVEEIMKSNPGSYVDREKLARDLSYDYSPDVMSREEYADLEGDDPDDLEYDFYVVDGNTEEVMFGTDDESTADREIDEYMETLADDLIEGGNVHDAGSYFDYEQYAYDLVVGGDIMVTDGYVFWNQ